jgi:hypothetical protein
VFSQNRDVGRQPEGGHSETRPKPLGELLSFLAKDITRPPNDELSEILSFIGHTDDLTPPLSASDILTSAQVRELFESGEIQQAIDSAIRLYEHRKETFSEENQTTAIALGDLLEYATRARIPQPQLTVSVGSLEQHWLAPLIECESKSPNPGSRTPPSLRRYMLRTLPQACEYAAQFGRSDEQLRPLADRYLTQLHQLYPFFPVKDDTEALRQYASSALIRAAAHIASWKTTEETPDLQALTDIATIGHERLAQFAPDEAELYLALFMCEGRNPQAGVKKLESIVSKTPPVNKDVLIPALDQLTGWNIKLGEFTKAQRALNRLCQALEHESQESILGAEPNQIVRAEEQRRVRAYQVALEKINEAQ